MGSNPSQFKGDDLAPKTVSWNDPIDFCRKRTWREGKTCRLLTEAVWE